MIHSHEREKLINAAIYFASHTRFCGKIKLINETDERLDFVGDAPIIAHNATFDHGFVMAAAERAGLKRNPFHPFATFDTAALSGLALGQTVLAKACQSANIPFDNKEAHSALYDTERTTELFCHIVNRWKSLGGWPLANPDETTDTEDEG